MSQLKTIFSLLTIMLLLHLQTNGQNKQVSISGIIKDKITGQGISFVNVVLKSNHDSSFISGTISNEEGRYILTKIPSNEYYLEVSYLGYKAVSTKLYVGSMSDFLEVPTIEMEANRRNLGEVTITARNDELSSKLDKKTFQVGDNLSQSGGSVLQAMQNLPGVTVQEGKVLVRGSDKIIVMIDGQQTALTGMGSQSGLDNIPASAIEKIEIINNPSSKYDANGNAGIINIVYKKNKKLGFNGKVGMTGGLGALWLKKENLPTIRPQYQNTPKINPSLSLNYAKSKYNLFLQADYLYTETLNKNEFTTRNYANGVVINQQLKRNRNTHFTTIKAGIDYYLNQRNLLTISCLLGSEKIIDRGDQPFFNYNDAERLRLWQFLEDELKTTFMATALYQYKFKEPGHLLHLGVNYTFHREDEKYFFENILPSFSGKDAFKLLSDEHVTDINLDYVRPLKLGKIEGGFKFRNRNIPTNMQFIPGLNSPLDSTAGGIATYREIIPALYSNYVVESKKLEAEIGLRLEYVNINYEVDPRHPVYQTDGYQYTQPFPNIRFSYKINEHHKLSFFYNRRVDRPNEVDIRIFPKYDDAEIIKVGNPALRPQFTNTFELGFKKIWTKGYLYAAFYHRMADGTITRVSSSLPNSPLIYAIFQNAQKSYHTGLEFMLSNELFRWFNLNINFNIYQNTIDEFTVENLYPVKNTLTVEKQSLFSGNLKLNNQFRFSKSMELQITMIYLAPDLLPQGSIAQRLTIDLGLKKTIQQGKGELFINATDLANTMIIKRNIVGNDFNYTATDYYETQVIRLGYSYKF